MKNVYQFLMLFTYKINNFLIERKFIIEIAKYWFLIFLRSVKKFRKLLGHVLIYGKAFFKSKT